MRVCMAALDDEAEQVRILMLQSHDTHTQFTCHLCLVGANCRVETPWLLLLSEVET